MKKILVLLILSYGHLFALDKESTLKIYHHVFAALAPKATIGVYTEDIEYRRVFALSKRILLSRRLHNADIALITSAKELQHIQKEKMLMQDHPILFVTDYHLLDRSEDIVGAFYWRKGRSQLLFIRKRLDVHHIILPDEFNEYIVDEI